MTRAIRRWGILAVLLALAALAGACAGSGGSGDDDAGDDATGDDDTGDDDTGGTTPAIDALNPYPAEVFPGDAINMNFHFTDAGADLEGGAIHVTVGDHPEVVKEITYDPGTDGHITTSVTTGEDWAAGVLTISLYVEDAAGRTSNTITADFTLRPPNTAPAISNLRFDPNPVCNLTGSAFQILFDFVDPDGNVGGGSLAIYEEGSYFPQQFFISPDFHDTSGTIPLDATLTGDAPDGTTTSIGVILADDHGAMSERLDASITFSHAACP